MARIGRTCALLALIAACVAAEGANAAPTGGRADRAATVSVKLPAAGRSQAKLANRGRVKLKVRAGEAGLVLVDLRSTSAGEKRFLTRSKGVRFTTAGKRDVRLKLTPAGRRLVRACTPRKLLPTARAVTFEGGVGKAARQVKRMRIDLPACAGGGPNNPGTGDPENPTPKPYDGPAINTSATELLAPDGACDFLDRSECLYPFPNDRFTKADPGSETGRRVDFQLAGMPRNIAGVPVNPAELNRSDGFSPGSSIIVKVPGLDTQEAFDASRLVPETDMSAFDNPSQAVVVIDTTTHQRWPIWAELDSNPPERTPGNTDDVTLIVRPAVNFAEGHRYVVALRNLKDAAGREIPATDAFRVYRDRLITQQPAVESRRDHMESIFDDLKTAGVTRSDLYLAWDFTVASQENLSGRMLSIRDDAFAQLGDTNLADGVVQGSSPAVSGLQVTDYTPAQDSRIARKVTGNVSVPCYMNTPGCLPAGSTFNYPVGTDPDRMPQQLPGNNASVAFTCILPRDPVTGNLATNVRPSLYGHGLLGSASEVEGGNVKAMAFEHKMMMCATDWYGFATVNVPNVLLILQDISQFPLLGDETQQGMLDFLFLGRAMIHSAGLNSNAAFQDGSGNGVIDTDELYYDGNSQGGILGGSLTAVAPDYTRAVLGVPGMNYSTLLPRSVDFEPYAEGRFTQTVCDALSLPLCPLPGDLPLGGLYDNYPDELERPLIFALLQMQWDRAEANGYAAHMTDDPLPNTPKHQVLLDAALGDHQVANVAAQVEARTIGAGVYAPETDPGRLSGNAFFGLDPITFPRATPYTGSALVTWDGGPLGFPGGSAEPPYANVPPRPPEYGSDPHSYPRNDVKARAQKSAFLMPDGRLANFCTTLSNPVGAVPTESGTPTPCYSNGYQGAP